MQGNRAGQQTVDVRDELKVDEVAHARCEQQRSRRRVFCRCLISEDALIRRMNSLWAESLRVEV
jgi:hypothetical protein